ncbi:unnamed protein product [Arctogadus glacialis]
MFQRKRQKEDASEPNQSGFIVDEEGPCVVSKMEVFLGASTSMATIWNFFNRGKRNRQRVEQDLNTNPPVLRVAGQEVESSSGLGSKGPLIPADNFLSSGHALPLRSLIEWYH